MSGVTLRLRIWQALKDGGPMTAEALSNHLQAYGSTPECKHTPVGNALYRLRLRGFIAKLKHGRNAPYAAVGDAPPIDTRGHNLASQAKIKKVRVRPTAPRDQPCALAEALGYKSRISPAPPDRLE